MNIKKRLEKLEDAVRIKVAQHAVTEIWLVPGGETSGAARWTNSSGAFVSVTDEELAEINEASINRYNKFINK